MSSNLKEVLQRLQNRGETALATELESLIEATASDQASETRIPLSRRLLAQAVHEIRQGRPNVGHDYIGAAVESYRAELSGTQPTVSDAVTAQLDDTKIDAVPSESFLVPMPANMDDSPDFETASAEVVTAFAHLLIAGGYTEEARAYLSGRTNLKTTEGDESMKSDRKTLEKLQSKFKSDGNTALANAVKEIIADLEEETDDEACPPAKAEEAKKEEKEEEAPAPAADEKPVLEVEPPAQEETEAKMEASAALKSGDLKKAKQSLAKAQKLERLRIVAALIKAGDMELAMEGLEEGDEGQGGYASEEAPEVTPIEEPVEDVPEEAKKADADKPAEEPKEEPKAEEATPVGEEPAKSDEEVAAQKIAAAVKRAAKTKQIAKAKKGVASLASLEQQIVAGVKKAEETLKDSALASEGYAVWMSVRKSHLEAVAAVATAEGDDKACDQAMEAIEALEGEEGLDDTLESQPEEAKSEELAKEPILPAGGVQENDFEVDLDNLDADAGDAGEEQPKEDGEEPKEEEEADAMKYECLQSIEEVKAMKVDRNGLAMTFWSDEKGVSPYWTVQANGKPIAEIHLADQDNAEEIRSFFCDEGKYPQAVEQSVGSVGMYDMLKGVKARFYANAIDKSAFAKKMKDEAVASVSGLRTEKLADLRRDFVDAVNVSAEALNKGIMKKPNTLKAAFVKTLASYGIHNPALVVEAAFAEGFNGFMDQIVADAQEYLEMPKDAFAHAKRMILDAANVAHASANQLFDGTLGQRMQQNNLPLGSVPAAQEAPAREAEIQASMRSTSEREKSQNIRKRIRLSDKF